MSEISSGNDMPGAGITEKSQTQGAAEPVAGEDLVGLRKNRDELLAEKKALAAEKKKILAELEKFKEDKEKDEKKALLEQQKYKELYELEKAEKEKMKSEISESQKKGNFKDAAINAGVQPKFIKFVMAEMNQIEFDEAGNPTNAEAFFNGFKESYSQFFNPESGTVQIPKTDSAKTNLTGTQVKPFTAEEIKKMDMETFKKNEAEIDRQQRAGLIH